MRPRRGNKWKGKEEEGVNGKGEDKGVNFTTSSSTAMGRGSDVFKREKRAFFEIGQIMRRKRPYKTLIYHIPVATIIRRI